MSMMAPNQNCVAMPARAAARYWSSIKNRAAKIARYGRTRVASMALSSCLHGAVGGVEPGDQLLDRRLLDGQIVDAMICRYAADQRVCRRRPRIESKLHSATRASEHRSSLDVDVA